MTIRSIFANQPAESFEGLLCGRQQVGNHCGMFSEYMITAISHDSSYHNRSRLVELGDN